MTIRTIGPPGERFAEDHLRLLRAVRLAAQLGFEIEPETFRALQANAAKITVISAERIRDELVKLFAPLAALPTNRHRQDTSGFAGSATEPERRLAVGLPPEKQQTQSSPDAETTSSSPSPPPSGGQGWGEVALRAQGEALSPVQEKIEKSAHGMTRPTSSAARGLELLHESRLLEHVLPELAATVHCQQSPDFHPEGSVFNHLVLMLQKMPPDADPLLPWAILLHDIAKPLTASRDEQTGSIHFYEHERIGAEMAERILERLRFPRKQIDSIVQAVRCHMQFKDAPQMRKATLRRLLMRPTFPLELQLHRVDCLGSHGRLDVYHFLIEQAKELEKQPEIHPPLLKGDDLIELGMKPGPALGALLNEIREKQLQDELKTHSEAQAWAKQQIKSQAGNPAGKRIE